MWSDRESNFENKYFYKHFKCNDFQRFIIVNYSKHFHVISIKFHLVVQFFVFLHHGIIQEIIC